MATRTRSTSSHRARSRNPHTPPSDATDQKAARDEQRRQAAREDKLLGDIYDQGRKDARDEQRAKNRTRRSSSTRRAAGRGAKRRARKVGRAALAPTSSPTSGAQIVGTILALIALFLVLQNAPTFQKFIGGAATGLRWLRSPHTSIPGK
jgi:hypothetical protein